MWHLIVSSCKVELVRFPTAIRSMKAYLVDIMHIMHVFCSDYDDIYNSVVPGSTPESFTEVYQTFADNQVSLAVKVKIITEAERLNCCQVA